MKRLLFLIIIVLTTTVLSLTLGAAHLENVWRYIANPFFDSASPAHQIIWQIRAPRILAALLVGATLGMAGVLAQGATNNPLADPAILGTSAGASLGVLVAVLLNVVTIGSYGAVVFATLGALLATLLTFSLGKSTLQVVIVGIGVSAVISAIVGLTVSMISRPDARSVSFWSLGSLALVNSQSLWTLLPIFILCSTLAWVMAPSLDLLSLGDNAVRHIGVSPQRIRLRAFLLLAIAVASTVSTVGTIAFLALAAPHIARFLFGPRVRSLIVRSALIGALILLIADTTARSIAPPHELPIGLITSIIGAPILIITLKRRSENWQ